MNGPAAPPGAPDDIVVLENVEKRYGAQAVLAGVSLRVARGELVSLVGRSGSGKSTLLHVIGGLDRRYTGRARVLGSDLDSLSESALAHFRNRQVGFVFQSFNLLDHMSCVENVMLPHYFSTPADDARMPGPASTPIAARVRQAALEALDRVGIAEQAEKRPGELSGGQKQRVAIARALYHRPSLLLADEPTGNLDSETGERIIELFSALHAGGLTLIVVTHEERVSRAARRVLRLQDGRFVDEDRA